MRSALLFTTILLFAIVPFSNPVAASGLDENSGITITATFDNSTEMTTLNITMPVTNNATLLDELKDTTFSIFRISAGDWPVLVGTIASEIQFCTQGTPNFQCSGATFQIEYYPLPFEMDDYNYILTFNSIDIVSNTLEETISYELAVENMTGEYSEDLTTLSWEYPGDGVPMNHSIMIYSHDSPATRENWNSMTKTIVSSSIAAGTTSFEINHSSYQVEREVYYSVTLLYETSEDTRFLGSNTLSEPLVEDNTAPLFIGELSAVFDPETFMTTLDWEEGVDDDDLSINIYRYEDELDQIDQNTIIATIDSNLSSFIVEVPVGEHRQSIYAITLQDNIGNEITQLTELSPVSDPVLETTISISTISSLSTERFGDGTIIISWEDNTQNQNSVARIWRSVIGPIESFQDIEELSPTNVSNEQFAFKPLNPVDQAWYAITIEAAWGPSQQVWHDERLISGVNSMSSPTRETEDVVDETPSNISARVIASTGFENNFSDGDWVFMGQMYEGDIIIIVTSSTVSNITCYDTSGEGSSISTQSNWSLSFSANQSAEKCLGLISDGDEELAFTLTWNYNEPVVAEDDDDEDESSDGDDKKGHHDDGKKDAGVVILGIISLVLLVYLFAMMRSPTPDKLYFEEE